MMDRTQFAERVSRLQFERGKAERASRVEPPPLCRICETLLSWFLDPPQERIRVFLNGEDPKLGEKIEVMHLGTFQEALASPCSQHTTILKHLQKHTTGNMRCAGDVRLYCDFRGVHVEELHADLPRGTVSLKLVDRPGKTHGSSHGQCVHVLDREWIDLPAVRQWIYDCSELHGEKCDNPMKIMRVIPDLLVDVRRKFIVDGREIHQYMALSYRLGNAAPFRLNLRDLNTYRKHAILEDVHILEGLPLTVRHAILLADQLGFDYLWTDVLCIVHDGPATLADQLDKMSAIYASAATTIVATDGDGTDGILGLHGISGPRDFQQASFEILDERLMIEETDGFSVNDVDVEYNSRGWTYQECIMSARKIVFMNQQARWQCSYDGKRECDDRRRKFTKPDDTVPFRYNPSYPDFAQVSELLSWYNNRDLTYPGDSLPAISGLLAVLSRGFADGFLYGLPEKFFEIGLTWRPTHCFVDFNGLRQIDQPCRLRQGSPLDRKSHNTAPGASGMPSWSWTAWKGWFSFGHNEVARLSIYSIKEETFCETSPITKWFTGSGPTSCNRRRIMSNWHMDRKSVDEQDMPLPRGWIRAEASIAPFTYLHESLASEEMTYWRFPFPMPDINTSTPFKVPEQTRYLFCITWKAYVLLCDRRDREETSFNSLSVELWANDLYLREGRPRIGRIWLHNKEQFEDETGAVTNADGRTALIDVVAISRSTFSGKPDGEDSDGESRPLKDRINILWVKWDNGIAYRVASGFVHEEDWKRLDLEEIDLVLG
jgi:hypothetical protein